MKTYTLLYYPTDAEGLMQSTVKVNFGAGNTVAAAIKRANRLYENATLANRSLSGDAYLYGEGGEMIAYIGDDGEWVAGNPADADGDDEDDGEDEAEAERARYQAMIERLAHLVNDRIVPPTSFAATEIHAAIDFLEVERDNL